MVSDTACRCHLTLSLFAHILATLSTSIRRIAVTKFPAESNHLPVEVGLFMTLFGSIYGSVLTA